VKVARTISSISLLKTYRHVIGVNLPWNLKWLALKLDIQRYSSRVKTPKDNPEIERFNEI
jgi:hypothetical protein